MSYYDSLANLLLVLIPATVIGWKLVDLLPWRLRPESRFFFGPALGLAVLIHLAVLLGWLGHGYRRPVCLAALAVLLLVSLWGRQDLTALIKNLLLTSFFAVVAAAGVLYPVWRYAAINAYNDTFTYLVHGQWLQTHAFTEQAVRSGQYPAWTQVVCYQWVSLRMGASFMLAYVQALMGADWSYQVYPAVIALPVVACALVVAGTAYSVCRSLSLSLLCGAGVGLTLNGVSYGAANGFLPQTWGLAFAVASLALAGETLRYSAMCSKAKSARRHWIPVALVLSAAIHCYSEMAPFLIAGMGLFFCAAAVQFRQRLGRLFAIAGWVVLLCAILVNLEWIRFLHAMRTQTSAVVGMAVNWPWWHFISLAMGLRSGVHDVNAYLLGKPAMGAACVVGMGLIATALWWSCRNRGKFWNVAPHAAFVMLIVAAFIYFRLFVKSPWPTGTGQTWNQFKLSNWATPSVFCLLAVGIGAIARRSRIHSAIMSVVLLGILAAGVVSLVRLAESRTRPIRQDTGLSYDPFSAFFKIRQFSGGIPRDTPVYLNTGEGKVGLRQMLMYALEDRPVAGNWTDDSWVKHWLPVEERELPMDRSRWMVTTEASILPVAQRAGNLWLAPTPRTWFILQSVEGGYPRETDQTGWWYWTSRQLHFTYGIHGEWPQRVIISFGYMTISDHRPVHLHVGGKSQDILLDAGQQTWTSEPIEVDTTGGTLDVIFDCDLPPVKLSEQDPRLASYLIKNLMLRRVEPQRRPESLHPTLTSGWYPIERTGQDWVCWTAGRGQLSVVVSNDTMAELSGQILSAQRPNDVDVLVNGAKVASLRVDWTTWEFHDFHPIDLPLKTGENTVEFSSRNPAISIATDNRALAVAVKNLSLTTRAD